MSSFGFIITRHVTSEKTNRYWNKCIQCLRALYPSIKIVVIDDNSDKTYLKMEYPFQNVTIIESQMKGRGELLPYVYYLKNKFFDNAIIIHDSVFIHKRIHFEKLISMKTNVLPLWYFYPDKENLQNTTRIAKSLTNSTSIQQQISLNDSILGMPHTKWYGCFGVQSFINHNFLMHIESKYHISNMINSVSCRPDRCCLERIFGSIFYSECPSLLNKKYPFGKSLFGNIMTYMKWGYTYDDYQNHFKQGKLPKSIIKVWTGR
jgi:hypothetical protein